MTEKKRVRKPFWLATSSYVMLVTAAAIAVFCIVWWVMQGEGEESPWIFAGLCACATIGFAVGVRELILRKLFVRYQLESDRVERLNRNALVSKGKLTLEKHAAMLKNLEQRSHQASSSAVQPQTHLDLFRSCTDYLARTDKEIRTVTVGSPRLAAFRHGQEVIKTLHKHHLLMWAAGETNILTQEARIRVTISEKIETAQRALSVLESALHYYPDEMQLLDSVRAIKGFIVSVRVSHLTEEAEKEAFKGRYEKAIDFYYDALFYLSREAENLHENERKMIEKDISLKIGTLQRALNG
jgi:hypothetical protein